MNRSLQPWLAMGGIALLAVVFFAAVFFAFGGPSYFATRAQARKAFVSSRYGKPGSYEFVSHGIRYGMTPDEVTNAMAGAAKTLLQGPQETPPWDGTVDIYIFRYGPEWQSPLGGEPRGFYEEWYWVYYTPDGLAVKLERAMVFGDGEDSRVDLKTKTMCER